MTHSIGPAIADRHRQIIYGTVLGGSSIVRPVQGKNCYLAMRDRDLEWLTYKTQELSAFFKMDEATIKRDKNTFRCYSVAYPAFNDFYSQFYQDGEKIVRKEILERLNDVAWMIWFQDAGRKSSRKAYLRTHKFGEEGTVMIADYFNSLDVECSPHLARGRHEIVFSNKGAHEFLKVISRCLPPFIVDRCS